MFHHSLFLHSVANVGPGSCCLLLVLFGLCGFFVVFVCLACCDWFNIGLTPRAWVPNCGTCLCIHKDCHSRHDEHSNGSKK